MKTTIRTTIVHILVGVCFLLLVPRFLFSPVIAQNPVHIYFFWSKTCPHCAKEKLFLSSLLNRREHVEIRSFEIHENPFNSALLSYAGEKMEFSASGVPVTIIGDTVIIGYLNDETTGKQIEDAVTFYSQNGDPDTAGKLIQDRSSPPPSPMQQPPDSSTSAPEATVPSSIPDSLHLPLVGSITISSFSLPVLTVIIALFDGFNPCAMWVLLFLISLLIGMQDRMKMWIIGSTFIFVSGFVYFLFLSAWLNIFLFLGFISWIRSAIGILAVAVSIYYLRDYLKNKEGACTVVETSKRQKIFQAIRKALHEKHLLATLVGISVVAFAVNLIELVCSAGLPAIYTHVLSLHSLPPFIYYAYLLLYIVVFMLDDLVVFVTAMTTLHALGIEHKYARYSRLIGSIVLGILGILLLFKPESITFGS